jgi:hypothetical protein
MSIFEQYSANIPLFFPSKEYLYNLIINNGYKIQSRYNKIHGNNNYHVNLDSCLNDKDWLDFWINNADYYDEDNMKYIIYFMTMRSILWGPINYSLLLIMTRILGMEQSMKNME